MTEFSFVILYVENPVASAAFYARLLDLPVVESAPTFAMLPLRDGVMLGLWKRDGVKPPATAPAGGSEISFTVSSADAVRSAHASWTESGLKIAQAPTEMDFGHTFVALDPDGHRLRVFAPAAA